MALDGMQQQQDVKYGNLADSDPSCYVLCCACHQQLNTSNSQQQCIMPGIGNCNSNNVKARCVKVKTAERGEEGRGGTPMAKGGRHAVLTCDMR